jgi:acetyl-CoA synthetase
MRRHNIQDFAELLQRSTEDIAWFTGAVLDYLDIRFYQPYSQVVDLSRGIAWPRWVTGGKMNIVHNCLDKYIGTKVEQHLALIAESESGEVCTFTYGELYRRVNQTANALRFLGLGSGDAVGLYMPMTCEIVIAMLAIAKIGGLSCRFFPIRRGSSGLISRRRCQGPLHRGRFLSAAPDSGDETNRRCRCPPGSVCGT